MRSMTDASVMLTGESGVGKRFAANTIHQLSQRRRAPFVAINAVDVLSRLRLPAWARPSQWAARFFKPQTTARCSSQGIEDAGDGPVAIAWIHGSI